MTTTQEFPSFQTGVELRPDVLVAATSAGDVQAAVRTAADRGLTVRVHSTGHGAGTSVTDGLVVLTSGLDDVAIDPRARFARVGAGARWEQVTAAAAAHGLVPPAGSAPSVGAVGSTLGGGVPLLARALGYASDSVRALEVVTADGGLRRVTSEDDADLFEALRGGRDGLGVVTAVEIGLVPLDRFHGGSITFDAAAAPDVLPVFLAAAGDLPDEVTASAGMVPMPDVAPVPPALRGRHVLTVRYAATRADRAADALVARVREAGGEVLREAFGPLRPTEAGSIFAEPPVPHAYVGDNVMLDDLAPEDLIEVARIAGPGAGVDVVLDLRQLGGALAHRPGTPDAVPYRDAGYVLRVVSALPPGDDEGDVDVAARTRAVHRRVLDPVARAATGRSLNFVYGDGIGGTGAAEAPAVFPPALRARLAQVIADRDPEGRFGGNRFV